MADFDSNEFHNLRSVYTDFKITVGLVKSGYRFDDEEGPILIQQLEKALGIFKTHLDKVATMRTKEED